MIGLGFLYALAGMAFAAFAVLSARDRTNPKRWGNAAFWGLLAASFLVGGRIGDVANGLVVIALAAIAAVGGLGRGEPATTPQARAEAAARHGNLLFLPALAIPAVTVLGALVLKTVVIAGRPLIDPKQTSLVSLGLGTLVALLAAVPILRPRPLDPLQEGRRLMDAVGWAALLPQLLAALGAVFALGGVGEAVGGLIGRVVPLDSPWAAVVAYTVGMAAFTALMGNAFAAFPVMTAAVGLPLIVRRFGGDPAIMGAIGMLSGFCGTLTTPMAANFNVVPVALLELPDRWAVIRAQIPTALVLLAVNTLLMGVLVFRF